MVSPAYGDAIVVVTGAASGIGRAVGRRLPDHGSITDIASIGGWRWDHDFDLVRDFVAEVDHGSLAAWCQAHADLLEPSAYPFSKQWTPDVEPRRRPPLCPSRPTANTHLPRRYP